MTRKKDEEVVRTFHKWKKGESRRIFKQIYKPNVEFFLLFGNF